MTQDQATHRLAEILTRIAKLPSLDLDPPQFFANYLQLTVAATGSRGGAIWIIQPGQGPQCYCHLELDLCRINDLHQQQLILEAVQRTVQEVKPLVMPAGGIQNTLGYDESGRDDSAPLGNLCPYPLIFRPLKAAYQVAMVIQLIAMDTLGQDEIRAVVGLLDQIGETAETYLAYRRAAVLEDDRKSLARLLKYSEGVHDSLDAQKVVYKIANLGRDTLRCTRVMVWIDPKVKRGLRAVSGIDKPDRRAILMQAVEKLSKHCLEIKKPIVASREQLVEMPEEEPVTQLAKNYFNVSQLDQIFLQPIVNEDVYLGVIIAEGFEDQTSVNLAGTMATISNHGATALANALEMASVPMIRPLGKLQKAKKDPKIRRKWIIRIVIGLICLLVLLLLPWTIRIECACELTPKNMRVVESPLDNVQIVSIEIPNGKVNQGDVVAILDDLELQTQLTSKTQEREQELIKRSQSIMDSEKAYSQLQIDKLTNEINFYNQQIQKCRVTSPLTGTILTPQLERKVGMTLKRGDPIFEVAQLSQWQLRLDVPQEEIDWVRRGLENLDKEGTARVQFFLNAYPQYKLEAGLADVSQISQIARIKQDEGNVYEIRLDMTAEQLREVEDGLRVGIIGRAKIDTVRRPLCYVLLRKVIRFFRMVFF
ncbi:MAG: HlyD family efflux transporter periplasmic adaptor subunit [Sedimentisphaerales bacterium]|nr:HlyD family efflux transporter periplasmic adaptor subunit [Sedimentisphaerales bacterium]